MTGNCCAGEGLGDAGTEVLCALADETTQHRRSSIRATIIGPRVLEFCQLLPRAVDGMVHSRVENERIICFKQLMDGEQSPGLKRHRRHALEEIARNWKGFVPRNQRRDEEK